RPERARLLLFGDGRAKLRDLGAASDELRAVDFLNVTENGLALAADFHLPDPLGRNRLMIAAPHVDFAPGKLHFETRIEGTDNLVRVRTVRALDRLGDDVGCRVAP